MLQRFIDDFNNEFPDREIIFLVKAGSDFFDLSNKQSDSDYKGIYMPSPKEFYMGEGKRRGYERKTQPNKKGVKNTSKDVDFTLFSITKFFKLLCSGDFNMMELLFAPKDKIIINSQYFSYLMSIRDNLLISDISSFLGFVKKEYRRYGVNINHYKDQKNFLDFLKKFDKRKKLVDIWPEIVTYSHKNNSIVFTKSLTGKNKRVDSIKISQRLFQNTVKIEYVMKSIEEILNRYGHRQKKMAEDGVEFKGLYHAMRLIYEANDLYDHGSLKIPFSKDKHSVLWDIKYGIIGKQEIFKLIDIELDKLQNREKYRKIQKNREKYCKDDADGVMYKVDKLIFQLSGKKKIEYLVSLCYT
jgi:predicted nucleotidyltransferase